ncbi:MAG: tetratricopeptide repeat protein [Spirochaetaceae bacterium]|jgi:tetratricopeptide (TPR) repeat protein|nr:tetratricopeptide repeat protein [Spirochaetaceae bacterium]
MANGLRKLYYDLEVAENAGMDYKTFMERQWMSDLSGEMRRNSDRQIAAGGLFATAVAECFDQSVSRAEAGIAGAVDKAAYRVIASQQELGRIFQGGIDRVNNTLIDGFSGVTATLDRGFAGVSYQLGELGVAFAVGAANIVDAVGKMSVEVCDRLDAIHDVVNNPRLTTARELYRCAAVNYGKGFYEEARDDLKQAVEKNRTDYLSWFLLGKAYLLGVGEFSSTINLEDAILALSNTAKYISPDIPVNEDAKLLAAEAWFYLGVAKLCRSHELQAAKQVEESRKMLTDAQSAFERSYSYSDRMLESRFNVARCKALRGDTAGALGGLRPLIERDAAYCVKAELESDFDAIRKEYHRLIEQMRDEIYAKAVLVYKAISADYERAKREELVLWFSSFVSFKEHIQQGLDEDLPYVDMRRRCEELMKVAQSLAEEIRKAKIVRAKAEREAEVARERAEREAEYERKKAEEAKAEEAEAEAARRKAADREKALGYVKRAAAYCEQKSYDRAIADCTEAIRLNPEGTGAYYWRAVAYKQKGYYDRAITDCTESLRIAPNPVDYILRAEVYEAKGDYDRAITDYTEAIRLDPVTLDIFNSHLEGLKKKRGFLGLW